jgi:peptide/nickel transport system ATP-binding protein
MKESWLPASDVALEARDVHICYLSATGQMESVVDGAGIQIRRGRTVALVGESGSGKSQLLHGILGICHGFPGITRGEAFLQPTLGHFLPLLRPDTAGGRPRFAGNYSELRQHLTVLFQGADSHLHPFHPVRKQFLRHAQCLSGRSVVRAGGPTDYVRKRLAPLFRGTSEQDAVGAKYPAELSGGQRARVGLCLALASPAPLLIADEPTTGLDPGLRLDIYLRLRDEVEKAGRTLLIISHDVELVARFARDLFIMRKGRIVERVLDRGADGLIDDYSRLLFSPLDQIARNLYGTRPEVNGTTRAALPGPAPADRRTVALRAAGVSKSFRSRSAGNGRAEDVSAVRNVNLVLYRGESVGLVGESGCGKSTLARMLAGLLPPDGGTITFVSEEEEREISRSEHRYRRCIQLLHQNPDTLLHPRVTVAGLCRDSMGLWRQRCRFRREQEFLAMAHLDSAHAAQLPGSLSGGERRRIGLARVLAGRPELVLADEVVSGLDRVLQARIYHSLMQLRSERLTLLVISHDLELVRHLCDRVLIMKDGCIVDECRAGELRPGLREHHPYTQFLLQAESLAGPEGEPVLTHASRTSPPPEPSGTVNSSRSGSVRQKPVTDRSGR